MPYTLCLYYSRTGTTEKLIREIAQELGCEMVRLEDGVDRAGLKGWLRSGMQAMSRRLPPVRKPKTALPLSVYDLVIIGTPVWAGRCSAPVRSFLMEYGEELRRVAYVITRGGEEHYEAVFDQMDLYTPYERRAAVSLRSGSVGYAFWQEEFLRQTREFLQS